MFYLITHSTLDIGITNPISLSLSHTTTATLFDENECVFIAMDSSWGFFLICRRDQSLFSLFLIYFFTEIFNAVVGL